MKPSEALRRFASHYAGHGEEAAICDGWINEDQCDCGLAAAIKAAEEMEADWERLHIRVGEISGIVEGLKAEAERLEAENERLRADCRTLELAAAEANALVLSHEAEIERLRAAVEAVRAFKESCTVYVSRDVTVTVTLDRWNSFTSALYGKEKEK